MHGKRARATVEPMAAEDTSSASGAAGRDREGEGEGEPGGFDAKGWLTGAAGEMRESFARNRRVMSFGEYFSLFGADPARHVRSAAQYLRDVFDHFGTEPVR